MDQLRNFWVFGGDGRQRALAGLLEAEGHTVTSRYMDGSGDSLEGLPEADCVVLPAPVEAAPGVLFAPALPEPVPLEPVLARVSRRSFLCGGRVGPGAGALAAREGLVLWDYFSREELAAANAVPTAEGALQLAMERLPITVHGARILILGFGRVGQAAALRFRALGGEVTVAARRYEALALAEGLGCRSRKLGSPGSLTGFDLAVNTVPAPVLDGPVLARLRQDCLILDLASLPGGVDDGAAAELGLTVVHALSLPGKVAPVTAGAAIRDAIYHMLEEREVSIGG